MTQQLTSPDRVLTRLLGADNDDVVLIAAEQWDEVRQMKSDEGVVVEQRRETDGDWVLTEFVKPEGTNWYWTARQAVGMGFEVPFVEWLGPLEDIPERLLLSDAPLQCRRVDKGGWIPLRTVIKERCEAEA